MELIKKITYFLLLLTGKIVFAGSDYSEESNNKPNVIIIMTDDQGYGDLEFHGNPHLQTPALNQLTEESTRFTNFHVNATSMPTRTALMTGRYPSRSGVWHVQSRVNMDNEEITMADIFNMNGYQTAIFGKWHLGDMYPFRPTDRGFNYSLIHESGAIGYVPDYWGNDYYDDTYLLNNKPKKYEGYCTDVWFNNAKNYIKNNYDKDNPFFIYLPLNVAHAPFNVPEKYSKPYKERGLDSQLANFYGMIANVDNNMNLLNNLLKDLNIYKNTILMFLTDNGTGGGVDLDNNGYPIGQGYNAGMRGKKGSIYEGGHRVPFFLRWPGGNIPKNKEIDDLVCHMDILPTLIDLINLRAPNAHRYDGTSLVPLFYRKDESWPQRTLFIQHQTTEKPIKNKEYVVMTEKWRLINGEELYNMQSDKSQRHNVASQNKNVVLRLNRAYERWWKDISTNHDKVTRAVIGSDEANPTKLSLHEWNFGDDYSQHYTFRPDKVQKGDYLNGFWPVNVAQKGKYEFLLRRLPEEAKEKQTFDGIKARLKIGNVDTTKSISKKMGEIKIEIPVEFTGVTKLQTWIYDKEGNSKGAPFLRIKRLE